MPEYNVMHGTGNVESIRSKGFVCDYLGKGRRAAWSWLLFYHKKRNSRALHEKNRCKRRKQAWWRKLAWRHTRNCDVKQSNHKSTWNRIECFRNISKVELQAEQTNGKKLAVDLQGFRYFDGFW
jgi:hypothetical protein